ncbi:MAG: hypothetical protein ACLP05_06980 [Candidatus Kryptoniota bacterium]
MTVIPPYTYYYLVLAEPTAEAKTAAELHIAIARVPFYVSNAQDLPIDKE